LTLTLEAEATGDAESVDVPFCADAPLFATREKRAISQVVVKSQAMLKPAERCRGAENIRFLPLGEPVRSRTARTL
jgi:hypothetical protein